MPLLVSYRGRPVKRARRTADGIRVRFVNPVRGQRGSLALVSEDEWRRHRTEQYFPRGQMPDTRALAKQYEDQS